MKLFLPYRVAAILGFLLVTYVSILIFQSIRHGLDKVTSIGGPRVNLYFSAHIFLLIITTTLVLLPDPSPLLTFLGSATALAIPILAITIILRVRRIFSKHITQVDDIEWFLVGEKMGLLEMYCVMSRTMISLTKPALPIEVVRSELSRLSSAFPVLSLMDISDNGEVNCKSLPTQEVEILEIVWSFNAFLNRIYRHYRSLIGWAAEGRARRAFSPIAQTEYAKRHPEVFSSLFGGVRSDKASTGTIIDGILQGGIQRGDTVLLTGRPDWARDVFGRSFILQGLLAGEGCIYVSSLTPPERTRRDFVHLCSDVTSHLHIVDCHTFLTGEVEKLMFLQKKNVAICPNFQVLDYALSRILKRRESFRGRAILDIMTPWVLLSRQGGMASMIAKVAAMIEEFRKRKITAVILVDSSVLEPQELSLLSELVTAEIRLETAGDEVHVMIPKGGPKASIRSSIGTEEWARKSLYEFVSSALDGVILEEQVVSSKGELSEEPFGGSGLLL